eukprot:6196388-Prymnesium_polylepis.2
MLFGVWTTALLGVPPQRLAPNGAALDSAVMTQEPLQCSNNLKAARDELLAQRHTLEATRAELASTRLELLAERAKVSMLQTEDDPVLTAFNDALGRFHVAPMLVAALRLGVFEQLNTTNATFVELTHSLNVSSRGLDTLLDALLEAGLLIYDRKSETFANHPTFKTFSLHQVKIALLGFSVSTQRQFYYVADSVREGRAVGLSKVLGNYESLYEARAALPEVARDWDPWMQQQDGPKKYLDMVKLLYGTPAVFERNDMSARTLTFAQKSSDADPYDWRAGEGGVPHFHGKMLDWCGNTGGNAIKLAKHDSTLNITVLDLPSQCAKAQLAIEKEHLSH